MGKLLPGQTHFERVQFMTNGFWQMRRRKLSRADGPVKATFTVGVN
jgi:hypothetical protein